MCVSARALAHGGFLAPACIIQQTVLHCRGHLLVTCGPLSGSPAADHADAATGIKLSCTQRHAAIDADASKADDWMPPAS